MVDGRMQESRSSRKYKQEKSRINKSKTNNVATFATVIKERLLWEPLKALVF
jgi:hypothetical protein